jgi:hypothetical protein
MDESPVIHENKTCPICGIAICQVQAWKYCASKGGQRVCLRHCYQVCGHLYNIACTKNETAATITPETYNMKGEYIK